MGFFVKTEKFTSSSQMLLREKRAEVINNHRNWISELQASGVFILSGYIVNKNKEPGGGGLLILEAKDYLTAKKIIENDPMIKNNLVIWDLQEWIPIDGSKPKF